MELITAIGVSVAVAVGGKILFEFLEPIPTEPKSTSQVKGNESLTVRDYMMQVVDTPSIDIRNDPTFRDVQATVKEVKDKADDVTIDIINQINNIF